MMSIKQLIKKTVEQAALLIPYFIAHAKTTFGFMRLNKNLGRAMAKET